MALPQDGQNANGLTKVTQIPAGKELMFIDPTTNEGGIITLEDLTKQILSGITSQAFNLDAGQMTLIQALNDVNRQTIRNINLDSYTERDFNNYTSQGWYSFGSTPESLGLINCPGRSTGSLCVIILTSIQIQVWIDVDNNFYFRSRYPLYAWGIWYQIKLV